VGPSAPSGLIPRDERLRASGHSTQRVSDSMSSNEVRFLSLRLKSGRCALSLPSHLKSTQNDVPFREPPALLADHCGGGEIRTHDTLSGIPHFECGAFNHSATPPYIFPRFSLGKIYLFPPRNPLRVSSHVAPADCCKSLICWLMPRIC
jgi:hypothetical protein